MFPKKFGGAVAAFMMTVFSSTTYAQVYTPGKGDPDRKAIMDAIRPQAERDLGPPVEFVVNELNVSGTFAFVSANAQRKGGVRIDANRTPYARRYGSEAFDCCHVEAVLRKQAGVWRVQEQNVGSTDVWYESWCGRVPRGLISICP